MALYRNAFPIFLRAFLDLEQSGMDAKRSSIGKAAWKHAKTSLLVASTSATCLLNWTSRKMLPFCRDHVLSIIMLVAVPLGVAAFFWGSANSEKPAAPAYLQNDAPPELIPPLAEPSDVQLASAVTIGPHNSLAPEAPNVLPFADEVEDFEFDDPQPLPIAIESPAAYRSLPTWDPRVPAKSPTETGSAGGVWLTGTIEDSDISPSSIQNTSRVHEITSSNRNE